MSERLSNLVAEFSGNLAQFLDDAFPNSQGPMAQNIAFLRAAALGGTAPGNPQPNEPVDRLSQKLAFARKDLDLLLLAGLPEEHEGFAAVFRSLHPRGEARPTVGLAAQLFNAGPRRDFFDGFETSPALSSGAVKRAGEGPYFDRSLETAEALWPALHGAAAFPAALKRHPAATTLGGLDTWLAADTARIAAKALAEGRAATLLVTADREEDAYSRSLALVQKAGRTALPVSIPSDATSGDLARAAQLHALARGQTLVLRFDSENAVDIDALSAHPDVIVVTGRAGGALTRGLRPSIVIPVEPLSVQAREAMWRAAVPALASEAAALATRFPVEPGFAAEAAADLALFASLNGKPATFEVASHVIRGRAAAGLGGSVKLIRATATWDKLVLKPDRLELLQDAVSRLDHQAKVLDEWGFLKDRSGARGVRMLFSGPPGTGKTLSAEVLAKDLGLDLLLVDISRVVSKWIGETEKNLAAVFDAAERSQAVLFFDEAEALFGRRTEVSDAHDRYANLETAYLLARLERFEGLAVLASNLRQNIDPAFLRRLEFIVEFEEPDREERHRLWECHIPDIKLLDDSVNLFELATLYPVVGAFIRNAAVAAAFLAAADGRDSKINRLHFIRAIRREYEKVGRAFPGYPVGLAV